MDSRLKHPRLKFIRPTIKDPRLTLLVALTTWTLVGQNILFFNRAPFQIFAALVTCCVFDFIVMLINKRMVMIPLSAAITGLSLGILLESYDVRIFYVASIWAIASKYLIKLRGKHVFNPSNFGIIAAIFLSHGLATVAPGSQWGGDYRYALIILVLGIVMMRRVNRLILVLAWLGAYIVMGLVRMAIGQGGLVFVLGPMTGAEFSLFTFSMIPDPKTSPTNKSSQLIWGLLLGVFDGILRIGEFRFSMFYSLFVLCLLRLPVTSFVSRLLEVTRKRTVTLDVDKQQPLEVS